MKIYSKLVLKNIFVCRNDELRNRVSIPKQQPLMEKTHYGFSPLCTYLVEISASWNTWYEFQALHFLLISMTFPNLFQDKTSLHTSNFRLPYSLRAQV
jgi:hypothetical protein